MTLFGAQMPFLSYFRHPQTTRGRKGACLGRHLGGIICFTRCLSETLRCSARTWTFQRIFHGGGEMNESIAIAKNMFRFSENCFCQHTTVSRECAPIDARHRDRYRHRNRDRTVIVEVDTDSEPDTDSDDSGTLGFVYRLLIGVEF